MRFCFGKSSAKKVHFLQFLPLHTHSRLFHITTTICKMFANFIFILKNYSLFLHFQELNTALDEALKDYDIATNWLDGQQSVESKK